MLEWFLGFLSSLAAGFTQQALGSKKRDATQRSKPHPVIKSTPAVTSVGFASTAALLEHKNFFALAVDASAAKMESVGPAKGEVWRVARSWEVESSVAPAGSTDVSLVSWSLDGGQIATASDAFGLMRWRPDGYRLGRAVGAGEYGRPDRLFWSSDSKFIWLQGQTARNNWTTIEFDGMIFRQFVIKEFWDWGEGYRNLTKLESARPFNPWRPGNGQFLITDMGSVLHLVDVAKVPQATENLTRDMFKSSLGFSSLGAQDRRIFRYYWDPSGRYLAVTTGDPSSKAVRRVHIVHYDSGRILYSIPSRAVAIGWSQGGRLLWCECWHESSDLSKPQIKVWDSKEWRLRVPAENELSEKVARGLGLRSSSSSGVALSADGVRSLEARTPVPHGRYGVSILRASDGYEIFNLPEGTKHAAWNPTDPTCLVTVGGDDNPKLLRVWKLG